ncbi:hypothetical protein POM88_049264 [Heracleum sosnowskyi]|uniref:Uncharacterized protein n=1 Tax=Heracleum sosnowskyi TaxID=360622 RepID=A0AAD8GXW6_9APIA|nr:hypothetical protein POM88_049264 [Heracleum sosnowskyi]
MFRKREELSLRKRDMVDLNDLLFPDHRSCVYINVHDIDKKRIMTPYRLMVVIICAPRSRSVIALSVKAAQLAYKVIVLYFLSLHHAYAYSMRSVSYLENTYKYLLPENIFEVVLVPYATAELSSSSNEWNYDYRKDSESIFRYMPWTAIEFEDTTIIEHLVSRFGIDKLRYDGTSVIIDSSGMVLQIDSCNFFELYGGLGYLLHR